MYLFMDFKHYLVSVSEIAINDISMRHLSALVVLCAERSKPPSAIRCLTIVESYVIAENL